MIAPTYQRTQLWQPARGRLHTTVLAATIGAACFLVATGALFGLPVVRGPSRADVTMSLIVGAGAALPVWRARHPGESCPARLGDVMASPLDGWGHAFVYRCSATHLAITSAGEDGVFGTADDLRSPR